MMKNINLVIALLFAIITTTSAQERGIASYYSDSFHGRATASGEKYDKNALTGAHKTLPFGTIVQVTRLDNNKSVKIRINDLGPYISGRIVDLSGKAAEVLGLKHESSGTSEVVLKVLGKSDVAPTLETNSSGSSNVRSSSNLPPTPTLDTSKKRETPKEYVAKEKAKPVEKKEVLTEKKPEPRKVEKPVVKKEAPKKVSTSRSDMSSHSSELVEFEPALNFRTGHGYKFEIKASKEKLYGVQVAAVKDIEGMMALVTKYQRQWFDDVFVNVEESNDGKPIYKIVLGGFKDKKKASNYKKSLKKRKKIDGFVVPIK